MNGTGQSPVKVTLRDPLNRSNQLTYTIIPEDNQLARDWVTALKEILQQNLHLEKNFCFLGFPHNPRTVTYLCDSLNRFVTDINRYNATGKWESAGLKSYWIEEYFDDESVRFPNDPTLGEKQFRIKHDILNRLHNHFEVLQGTVWNLSEYYKTADTSTRYAIRQLNLLCHELESLILSQRKLALDPHWVRPSQITAFLHATRYELTDKHRQGFLDNRYDRVFGGVYMHWTQIGKTLFEVFRDESAPALNIGNDPTDISVNTGSTCEAITALKYFSGEFDVEWGRTVKRTEQPWHDDEQRRFRNWIEANGLNFDDPRLGLGYLKIGQVDIKNSFGTDIAEEVWQRIGQHLDIYSIEVDGIKATFDYNWADPDHEERQLEMLRRTENAVD